MSDQENTSTTPTPPQTEVNNETSENEVTESMDASAENTEVNSSQEDVKKTEQEKKEIKKQLKKLKLKIDGKEIEEEFDPSDDEYLTRQLQLAKVAQKRMGEFSQLEKEVKEFVTQLKKNPKKILTDPNVGVDIKKLVQEYIEEEIANAQKSPEQIEKEKLELELKQIREEREKEKEESKKRELQRLQEQEYERYDLLMTQALEKSELPKSPYIVKKMADYMLMGLQQGMDLKPEDVVPLVREEMQSDLKEMFSVMPEDVIEQIIGKDTITRIRKKNLAKAKQNMAPTSVKSSVKDVGSAKEEEKPKEKMTFKEFFKI